MSGQDLYLELQRKIQLLDAALKQCSLRGQDYAKSESEYRISLAKKILLERDRGVPVTIISDICRGDTEIAKLKFMRDVAETTYKAALEAINVYKLQIKVLENQIDREYRG
ncbi:MAG: hypothetical protein U0M23_06665 [Acutalibacteraceae bacterium]|nr:hypothetical protein [Acutalibacteraceae bacterium]